MKFTNYASERIYKFEKKLIPISDKRNTAKITVEISRDNFKNFYSYIEERPTNIPMEITIYDEGKNDSLSYRETLLYLIKTLNDLNISSIKFILSDSTLPFYTNYMKILGWKHNNKTKIDIKVHYNPISKETKLWATEKLTEENLIWNSKEVLENMGRYVDEKILENTLNLQKTIIYINDYLRETYYMEEMNEFDKVYLIYNLIKTFIRTPNRYIEIIDGIEILKQNYPNYILEPYGTWDNKEGAYEGKSRLMTILLNNPYIKIKATTIYGNNSQGKYAWVGIIINNKLYECCTSKFGPFSNLEDLGYQIDWQVLNQQTDFSNYERAFLPKKEIKGIEKKVKLLRR